MENYMMLWFDNDQTTDLRAKIEQAATYYQKKYGEPVNLCLVPASVIQEATRIGTIQVEPSGIVFENNFLIGKNCQ